MAASHKPVRMCISCRQRFFKPELTRYVNTGKTVAQDPAQILPGRGFYVCGSEECLNKLHKRLARLYKGD